MRKSEAIFPYGGQGRWRMGEAPMPHKRMTCDHSNRALIISTGPTDIACVIELGGHKNKRALRISDKVDKIKFNSVARARIFRVASRIDEFA